MRHRRGVLVRLEVARSTAVSIGEWSHPPFDLPPWTDMPRPISRRTVARRSRPRQRRPLTDGARRLRPCARNSMCIAPAGRCCSRLRAMRLRRARRRARAHLAGIAVPTATRAVSVTRSSLWRGRKPNGHSMKSCPAVWCCLVAAASPGCRAAACPPRAPTRAAAACAARAATDRGSARERNTAPAVTGSRNTDHQHR